MSGGFDIRVAMMLVAFFSCFTPLYTLSVSIFQWDVYLYV